MLGYKKSMVNSDTMYDLYAMRSLKINDAFNPSDDILEVAGV